MKIRESGSFEQQESLSIAKENFKTAISLTADFRQKDLSKLTQKGGFRLPT